MAVRIIELGFVISLIVSIPWSCCAAFIPADNYMIDCGSSVTTPIDSRNFVSDSFLLKTATNILANTTIDPGSSSGMAALYKTARIFTGPSSYSFPIKVQGRHLVRLHFFPSVYGDYNLTAATFSVSTQDLLLLHNFQPPQNSSMKEYSLIINSDSLILSFAPSGNSSAFVNAIEVISVPDDVIPDGASTVDRKAYQGLPGQALETVYRLNVGGRQVLPADDTLWRTWETDSQFLVDGSMSKAFSFSGRLNYLKGNPTPEIAPDIVYTTVRELYTSNTSDRQINMTWKLSVDANCSYLMRFHFCDVVSSSASRGAIFDVTVGGGRPILKDFEPASKLTFGSLATPFFQDFVLGANDASNQMFIVVSPSSINATPDGTPISPSGILNGLEIMKINFSTGSPFTVAPSDTKKNSGVIVGSVIGALVIVVAAAAALFMVFKRRKATMRNEPGIWTPAASTDGLISHSSPAGNSNGTTFTSEHNGSSGYRFPLVVLRDATNNFDESWVIGVGGFGKVYKGVLGDDTRVAVKRGSTRHKQGIHEFHNEIEMLSRLRHRHLVSLIGFCDEQNEMILVYEYMEKGTLKSHLYGSSLPPLTWKQRLEICIGSAKGLHYLHTSSARPIIHRDVKSANILLDENLLAKVADFGLSKSGPEMDQTHVSTAVKGSFGYLDPEYFKRQKLTEKSDVYSFGVVLLEVICARRVLDNTLPREMANLAEWGMKWLEKGELQQIVDSRIANTIRSASLRRFGETIEKCLADYGVDRPSMGDVLWSLEYALQLQAADSDLSEINSVGRIVELSPAIRNFGRSGGASAKESSASSINESSDASIDKVFSQLISPQGR